jgi:hypothetical protein
VGGLRQLGLVVVVAAVAAVLAETAFAWQVTVRVHGAGAVTETTPRALMNCSVSPDGKSEATITQCIAGTPGGVYNSLDVVSLRASVPAAAFNRGWRFSRWVDGSGSGVINCDPQDQTGNHTSIDCQFQIFENLSADLYFDDVHGPFVVTASAAPPSPTSQTTASFTFDATDDPDATFQCKLDRPGLAGAFATCGGPFDKGESYSGLATNGSHTFTVRAVDPSGNVGSSVLRSWTVDTVPPVPTITGGPAHGSHTNQSSATFTLGTNEGTLSCTLNGAPAACAAGPKSFTGLADGTYTFVLRATDAAGNQASVARSWTVDTVPPSVTLAGGPAQGSFTRSTGASFTIGTSDGALSCLLDGNAVACTPPTVALGGLKNGAHTFSVQAVDAAGNAASASRKWTVDTVKPKARFLAGPRAATTARAATFRFAANEKNVTFQCKLDRKPWAACRSPKTYRRLAKGAHTMQIRAKDKAGNVGAPVVRRWRIR